jgi:hypothetical protein
MGGTAASTHSATASEAHGKQEGRLFELLPARIRSWVSARFDGVAAPVRRGYAVWAAVGVVVAVPEIWAAAAKPPWPTISGTVGHLEARWNVVAVIVVAVLVVVAANAVRMPLAREADAARLRQADGRVLGRTRGGRFTPYPDRDEELSPLLYLPVALVCVAGGSFLAAALTDNKWALGYVLYGLIAVFCVVVPSALAVAPLPDVPFAGVFATLADLQRRVHVVALVLLAGLVVLLIHLAFYPWPDVFRHHPGIGSG